MAQENNVILQLPFDEANGSTVAYDYSRGRHDALLTNCQFVQGKQANCVRFDGTAYAEVNANILPLTGDFTVLAWIKANEYPDGFTTKRIGIFLNTDNMEGSRCLWLDINPESWGFFAVKKTGNQVLVYLDTSLQGNIILPSTLTGFAIIQDIYGTEYGYADLDEVKIYNVALTEQEIAEELDSISQLEYYIDGKNLKDFGIRVEESNGLLNLPKLKTPSSVDWADYHGKVIDLTEKRYDEREIELKCWVKASGKMDFVSKINELYEYLRRDGTQRLMVSIHPTKPLVYEVYCEDGVAPDKRWHDDLMIGTFTLKFKEPDPVKRVVRHQRTSTATSSVTVAFNSDKMVNIYWGDGTMSEDVYGDHTGQNAITHEYSGNGVYYVIVAGVVEDITDFETNGIVVWNRL